MSTPFYLLFTVVGLSWVYRAIIEFGSSEFVVTVGSVRQAGTVQRGMVGCTDGRRRRVVDARVQLTDRRTVVFVIFCDGVCGLRCMVGRSWLCFSCLWP